MSSKTVTTHFCDICGQVIHDYSKRNRMSIGVRFLTEQNEGTPVKPYYDYCIVDLCDECANRAITVDAIGAMGHNEYRWHKVAKPRAKYGELEAENRKLREQASEGERVGRMLLEYRDNPPVKTAGPIEGAWYESGDILAIIMEKDEFTTGELLTRLAYLMGAREER